jgi:hypothetical protein
MLAESRKLHIIEAVLKTDDDATLKAIEAIVENNNYRPNQEKGRFSDLLGVLSSEEAETMKRTIEESFEKINPDDWK